MYFQKVTRNEFCFINDSINRTRCETIFRDLIILGCPYMVKKKTFYQFFSNLYPIFMLFIFFLKFK